ncbi:MAG: error-prone DNA polymerase [Planctomycetota bacterium]|jgi:error-prone DNA polymerase
MPELPNPKVRPHPWSDGAKPRTPGTAPRPAGRRAAPRYAELCAASNFTFLTGASHPEELVEQAAALGLSAIAVTDRNSVAGIVRAHLAAQDAGLPLVVGSMLRLEDPAGLTVTVYPTDLQAYGRLCRLLTIGKRRAEKGQCHLRLEDLLEHADGLLAVALPPASIDEAFARTLAALRDRFDDDRLSLALSHLCSGDDEQRLRDVAGLAAHARVPAVATNLAHYHVPRRKALHDVLACIRHGCTLPEAGYRLQANAERHLRPPEEMARLLAAHPGALARSVEVAERASSFALDQIRYEYPHEVCPPGRTPIGHLAELAWRGAAARYPGGASAKVQGQIRHELQLIDELQYAPYFLTVHDLVRFARGRGILCQGRGAAANSAVCYCLGVTAVDPDRIDLLFERFVSKERNEPPDIDIDFEHERREEVIQYIYRKYGRDRAALTAEVISYRGRSAVREVGKALGLSLDCVDRLARNLEWWHDRHVDPRRIAELGIDPEEPTIRRFRYLVREIMGFPRHLSQHVGGFVITRGPLCELVPVENAAMADRTVIEWDKDDIDAMGMMKVDVLGLGMLTCLRKAFELVSGPRGREPAAEGNGPPGDREARSASLELHTVPPEDPAVYDMICAADTVGVFQIESRAQMSMLPRLRPRCFYDLVIEVAIVRPGPIQGDMVHPYLRRRSGEEPVDYPSDDVKHVLGKTLGVPLFQEQAMALAIVAAGFTPGEADQLRRAMAAWKRKGNQIERFGVRLIEGMTRKGYDRSFAERCFEQIKGFSEYGFPESHAASFALLVYVSAWLKHHEPASFAAALINSQPMGFYAPAQIVQDARDHGVEVRPVDVSHSTWDCTLETTDGSAATSRGRRPDPPALRLGMRLVKGLRQEDADAIAAAVRGSGPLGSIGALRRRSAVRVSALRTLARADAFRSMGLDRQAALWQVRALREEPLPMFDSIEPVAEAEPPVRLPPVPPVRQVMHDYEAVQLSLKAHPMSFLRERLRRSGAIEACGLRDEQRWPHGRRVAVAGICLVRQRPSTASGIVFMTLEDETGIANLIVRPPIYERCRKAARHGIVLLAHGRVERQGEVVHVLVDVVEDLDDELADLRRRSRDFR